MIWNKWLLTYHELLDLSIRVVCHGLTCTCAHTAAHSVPPRPPRFGPSSGGSPGLSGMHFGAPPQAPSAVQLAFSYWYPILVLLDHIYPLSQEPLFGYDLSAVREAGMESRRSDVPTTSWSIPSPEPMRTSRWDSSNVGCEKVFTHESHEPVRHPQL